MGETEMNICITVKSPAVQFAEKLANYLFRSLPEDSPLIVIRDEKGNSHFTCENVFKYVFSDPETLDDICAKVADGDDPLYCQCNGYDVLSSQIQLPQDGFVYAMIAVPDNASPVTIDVAEVVLSQIELVVSILDANQRARSAKPVMADIAEEFLLN